MNKSIVFGFALVIFGLSSMVQAQGFAKPQLLLKEVVQGMPKGERQEARGKCPDSEFQTRRQDCLPYPSLPGGSLRNRRRIYFGT